MRNFTLLAILSLLVIVTGISCSENAKTCEADNAPVLAPTNPNGDSELALLMRQMFEDLEEVKGKIDEGKRVKIKLNHEKLLTAEATQPERTETVEYEAFARHYLGIMEDLKKTVPEDIEPVFGDLVSSCITCHEAMCPGPLVRIRKLQ